MKLWVAYMYMYVTARVLHREKPFYIIWQLSIEYPYSYTLCGGCARAFESFEPVMVNPYDR